MPSRSLDDVADLLFRVLFSLTFLDAGLKHLLPPPELAVRLMEAPMSWLAASGCSPRFWSSQVCEIRTALDRARGGATRWQANCVL